MAPHGQGCVARVRSGHSEEGHRQDAGPCTGQSRTHTARRQLANAIPSALCTQPPTPQTYPPAHFGKNSWTKLGIPTSLSPVVPDGSQPQGTNSLPGGLFRSWAYTWAWLHSFQSSLPPPPICPSPLGRQPRTGASPAHCKGHSFAESVS